MKSLKDQLLKSGLATKQASKNVPKKKQPKLKKKDRGGVSDSAKQAEKHMQDKTIRDKELNRVKQQDAEAKAQQSQIKQLIDVSKIDREGGELTYNFTFSNKVKTIYVTKEQHKQLRKNQIGIVTISSDVFELVPRLVVEKISQRDESCIINNEPTSDDSTEDDPYADYQIPDDLIW